MSNDDMRLVETFYGMSLNNLSVTFGSFSNHKYILNEEYENDGCDSVDASMITDGVTIDFIYPDHIKKIYFIEGTIKGHITLGSSECTATVGGYKVTIYKIHENTTETSLFTTGWIMVNDELDWNGEYGIGEEKVYPFRIDAWEYQELTDKERIFVRVEFTNCTDGCLILWHSNDSTWEDFKISIPFRM